MQWQIKEIKLPLKFDWKISRETSTEKTNFIITVNDGEFEGMGEVAFSGRYGESREKVIEEFDQFLHEKPEHFSSVEEFLDFMHQNRFSNCLAFGIESAFLHFLSELSERSVYELLGTNKINAVSTSFSLPLMDVKDVSGFIEKWDLTRFTNLKIKVRDENDGTVIDEVAKLFKGGLIIDANEGFESADKVLEFIRRLPKNVIALEQPLSTNLLDEYKKLKGSATPPIFADESIQSQMVTKDLLNFFDGVNIKLMKAGGHFRALRQLREAKELGLKTMLGCMVETSLGIRSAIYLAHGVDIIDLDGTLLLKEDPFNLVVEENGQLFPAHFQ